MRLRPSAEMFLTLAVLVVRPAVEWSRSRRIFSADSMRFFCSSKSWMALVIVDIALLQTAAFLWRQREHD